MFYIATSYLSELIFTPIAFLINAKNIPKYSFREFRGVNVSTSLEVALNHYGCSLTGFTIFMDHFIIFNSVLVSLNSMRLSMLSLNVSATHCPLNVTSGMV